MLLPLAQQFHLSRSRNLVLLALAIFSLLSAAAAQAESAPQPPAQLQSYLLQISAQEPLTAHVDATISIQAGHLFTGEGGADQFPRHWAVFVQHLRAEGVDGKALAISELTTKDSDRGEWTVGDSYSGLAKLSYDLDLSFANTKWDPSNDKAGYFDGKAIYLVTKVLFLASVTNRPVELRIAVPRGETAATPWSSPPGKQFVYTVPSGKDLQQNTIVVGNFSAREVVEGNFHFTIALLGKRADSAAMATSTMAVFAQRYARMFPATPPSAYLLTIFDSEVENGESYERSAAFVTAQPLTKDNLILWGITQGHELFHFWCGQQIAGEKEEQSAWFVEGFTEYYADLIARRARLIPEELFIKKMENMLGKYLYFRSAPQFSQISILDSGTRKTSYRFGVYNGGWAIAFALDRMIREATQNKRSLDDFMRAMHERFGLSHRPFTQPELVATASEVAGRDLSTFFQTYLEGKEPLPVVQWLKALGYDALVQDYADEMYIRSTGSNPLRAAWLN